MAVKINPKISFESIDGASNVSRYLILHQYRWVSLGVLLATIIIAVIFKSFTALTIPVIYYTIIHTRASAWFMKQFAATNGLTYTKSLPVISMTGNLFNSGHSRSISNVIGTSHMNHPLQLFHYTYATGSGKSRRTYKFTVMEITFGKTLFAFILLQTRSMSRHSKKGKNEQKLKLEVQFDEKFSLHSTEGYEIEVFQIFTPEFLTFLGSHAEHFSIEFASNKVYIYDDIYITNKKQLHELFDVTNRILDSVGPLLNRLHDDFAVLHPYYQK